MDQRALQPPACHDCSTAASSSDGGHEAACCLGSSGERMGKSTLSGELKLIHFMRKGISRVSTRRRESQCVSYWTQGPMDGQSLPQLCAMCFPSVPTTTTSLTCFNAASQCDTGLPWISWPASLRQCAGRPVIRIASDKTGKTNCD